MKHANEFALALGGGIIIGVVAGLVAGLTSSVAAGFGTLVALDIPFLYYLMKR